MPEDKSHTYSDSLQQANKALTIYMLYGSTENYNNTFKVFIALIDSYQIYSRSALSAKSNPAVPLDTSKITASSLTNNPVNFR
jgi:hypothetical protein